MNTKLIDTSKKAGYKSPITTKNKIDSQPEDLNVLKLNLKT